MQAADPIQDHLATTLRALAPALVPGPDSAVLLAEAARWFSLAGGDTLFRQGTPSDTIFVVISGLLAAVMESPGQKERIIGRVGAGEVVGEMGCITGQPRTATVRALRSSEVLEISWSDIQRLAAKDPGIVLSICRTVVERMARAQEGTLPSFQPSTFAIVPLGEGTNERHFAEQFREALSTYGSTFLMTQDAGRNATSDELNRIEKAHDYVVYLADRSSPFWINRCLRQADIIVALGNGNQPARGVSSGEVAVGRDIPIVLVLQWDPGQEPNGTAAWLRATGASRHFHVRAPTHVRRVARMLTGNGFGLVLSGGGARGLAHLGVVQALRENGIEIDSVVGTSIGAIIGSAIAREWDRETMHQKIYEFIRVSPLWDLTFPRTSILAGRNVRRSFKRWFEDLQIEDMPTPSR
jgi:NTE family protein